jgi:hypothetical protein
MTFPDSSISREFINTAIVVFNTDGSEKPARYRSQSHFSKSQFHLLSSINPLLSNTTNPVVAPRISDGIFIIFAERFRSDISCGGTQSGSAATVTLHEIVCNAWFSSVVISKTRDFHVRGLGFFVLMAFLYSDGFAPSLPHSSDFFLFWAFIRMPIIR